MLNLALENFSVPLEMDAHGVVRVGGTRVTLYTILYAYNAGSSAEEIADQYPSVDLADIHATLSFYLRHRQEVDEYLGEQKRIAAEMRRQIEAAFPRNGLKERLLARRNSQLESQP